MDRNVEIKAQLDSVERARALLESLSDASCHVMRQEDTFFACKSGRLKLRKLADNSGELIYYERPNTRTAKTSKYIISKTTDPAGVLQTLGMALGVTGFLNKTRILYQVGQTRVHLDEVDGLGSFVEIEVVLRPDQTEEEGRRIAGELVTRLNIPDEYLIGCSYIDLLQNPNC